MDPRERAILEEALGGAGFAYRIDERAASFHATSADAPEGAELLAEAPPGWLRLSTTIAIEGEIPLAARRSLNLLYAETGFAHAHLDERGALRIVLALQAVDRAPRGAAVIAGVQHLLRVRHKLRTGQGEVRPRPAPDSSPTLEQAVAVLERTVELLPAPAGGFMGGLSIAGRDERYAARVHEAVPGVFAFDAWRLPPERRAIDEALISRIDEINRALDAGALIAFPDGFILYRWSCPRAWLEPTELRSAVLIEQAYAALARLHLV